MGMESDVEDSLELGRAFEVEVLVGRNRPHAELTEGAVWSRVESGVKSVFARGGSVRLRLLEPPGGYIRKISMDANPGCYRLFVFTSSEDRKFEILEWWESEGERQRGLVKFDDDLWDARKVSRDVDVALSLFREFYAQGDLLGGLAGFRSSWDPQR